MRQEHTVLAVRRPQICPDTATHQPSDVGPGLHPLGLGLLICEVMGLDQMSCKGLPPHRRGSKTQPTTGNSGEEFHL